MERSHFRLKEAIRLRPWVYVEGVGAAGVHAGKPIMAFRHVLGGTVIELAANSQGELRFKLSEKAKVCVCMYVCVFVCLSCCVFCV